MRSSRFPLKTGQREGYCEHESVNYIFNFSIFKGRGFRVVLVPSTDPSLILSSSQTDSLSFNVLLKQLQFPQR